MTHLMERGIEFFFFDHRKKRELAYLGRLRRKRKRLEGPIGACVQSTAIVIDELGKKFERHN